MKNHFSLSVAALTLLMVLRLFEQSWAQTEHDIQRMDVSTSARMTNKSGLAGPDFSMPFVSLAPGAVIFSNGAFASIGEPLVARLSNKEFTMEVGSVAQVIARRNSTCRASTAAAAERLTTLLGQPVSTKNRFLSFGAGDAGQSQAVRVTFDSLPAPFDTWNGAELWVGPTSQVSEAGANVDPTEGFPNFNAATLQCAPFYADYSALGVVHVFHEGIVPLGSYTVQVVDETCDLGDPASFSDPLALETPKWGDTLEDLSTDPPGPPDGLNNIVDAVGVIGRFGSQPGSIIKSRADLEPGCLDLTINITDVLAAITGFQGLEYPFEPSADDPCNSTCPNVLP